MERHRRIAALWNWLPAFRGVAEFESVHKAAIDLAVSPSALSRSVRLLEDALGQALFVRQGAGLKLTPYGQELFRATKEAIRRIDDVASAVVDATELPTLAVGTASPMLMAAIEEAALGTARPAALVRARARLMTEDEASSELLRGSIDLLVGFQPEKHPELDHASLGHLGYATYFCGRQEDLLEQQPGPLVAVSGHFLDCEGKTPALEVSSVAFAAQAIRALGGHSVLPLLPLSCLSELGHRAEPLREEVFAITRRPLTSQGLPGLEVVKKAIEQLLAQTAFSQ